MHQQMFIASRSMNIPECPHCHMFCLCVVFYSLFSDYHSHFPFSYRRKKTAAKCHGLSSNSYPASLFFLLSIQFLSLLGSSSLTLCHLFSPLMLCPDKHKEILFGFLHGNAQFSLKAFQNICFGESKFVSHLNDCFGLSLC